VSDASIQEQLGIIRSMIEQSRHETAESGHFFIWMGVLSAIAALVIRALEGALLGHLIIPVLAVTALSNGVLGYVLIARRRRAARARSYPGTVYSGVWLACGMVALMIVFLLPHLHAIPWELVPVLVSLVVGIGVFSSGVIFEARVVTWSSLAWWGGAIVMSQLHGGDRAYVMAAVILLGWVLPGVVLNRNYRRQRDNDES